MLPQKPKKKYGSIFVLILLGITVGTVAIFTFLDYADLEQQLSALNEELDELEVTYHFQYDHLQDLKSSMHEGNFVVYYEQLAAHIRSHWLPPLPMMNELTSSLPANAQIERVSFDRNGQLQLNVLFEQYSQVVDYVNALEQSPIVRDVSVSTLQTLSNRLILAPLHLTVSTTGGAEDE